jgi:hypothetical protein
LLKDSGFQILPRPLWYTEDESCLFRRKPQLLQVCPTRTCEFVSD